jgi:hypothetical protein
MADEVVIVRQVGESGFDRDGRVRDEIRVEFRVGDDGPFAKRFPAESFDGAAVRRELDEFARQLKATRGGF